jgi:hypothetical protein
MPESVKRFRFGLPSLLILPLWVSPLFLSTVFIRQQFAQEPGMALFFNMLGCTAVYAAFFTARSRRRVYEQVGPTPRHVLPAACAGALFGVLFMVQIVVPWQTALVIHRARSDGHSLPDFLHRIIELAPMAGLLGLFGLFLGAFGGSLVGMVFDWRYTHARTIAPAATPRESPTDKA